MAPLSSVRPAGRRIALIALCIMGFVPTPASAATRYVTPVGNDRAAGTAANPWRTVGRALAASAPGDTINVASGTYPRVFDQTARAALVTVQGYGPTPPRIAGAVLAGAQRIRFSRVAFTAPVLITWHASRAAEQPAQDLTFSRVEVTTGNVNQVATASPSADHCLDIRNGSRRVLIEDSWIHECSLGVGGNPRDAPSRDIVLQRNLIERFPNDAIQFGAWEQVRIVGNTIRQMRDPLGIQHNDGIQITGRARDVRITGNRITDSRVQLIMVQDPYGPNEDIEIANNLIARAGGIAVQLQGVQRVRLLNTSVWDGFYGAVLLRRSPFTGLAPDDAIVANNVLGSLAMLDTRTGVQAHNVIATPPDAGVAAPTDVIGDPRFVAPAREDFRLAWGSPATGIADPAFGFTPVTRVARPDPRDTAPQLVAAPRDAGTIP